MSTPASIPVVNADGVIVERAGPARVRQLLKAPNATIVRKRKGAIVRILLASVVEPEDALLNTLRSNPRTYSHHSETETNVENVWTLKRIPASAADLFTTAVTECLA